MLHSFNLQHKLPDAFLRVGNEHIKHKKSAKSEEYLQYPPLKNY